MGEKEKRGAGELRGVEGGGNEGRGGKNASNLLILRRETEARLWRLAKVSGEQAE